MHSEDHGEVRAFVAAQRGPLYRTAFLLVGDPHEAEDLVQSTLVRVITAWHRIERRDAPEVYARRALVNLARNRWRRRRTATEYLRRQGGVPSVADPAVEVARRDAVWAALGTLPTRMRAVLVLRYFEDLSEAETAAVLGCSVGTVKSQTSKALARLRKNLQPDLTLSPPDLPGATEQVRSPR